MDNQLAALVEEQRPPIRVATPCRWCGALIWWNYSDLSKKGKPRPYEAGNDNRRHTPTQCKLGQWHSKMTVAEIIDPLHKTSFMYDEWNH